MDSQDSKALLIVEPSSQIRFRGPFNRPVSAKISLINPTDYKVIFKLKTSAPSSYGVRPNFGLVHPRNFMEVEIVRQPFHYDPKEKINHRFLIQSVSAPSDIEDINAFWKSADPKLLVSTKLRCIFEMPHVQLIPKDLLLSESVDVDSFGKIEKIPSEPSSKESLLQKQIESINSENRHLRNENAAYRKENSMLKNEILQIRSLTAKTVKETKSFPFLYILLSVTMVVVCILIGKFFL